MEALQCPGTLAEPEPGEFACSLGEGCEAMPLMRRYEEDHDDLIAQQYRDAHPRRGAPDWLTDEL